MNRIFLLFFELIFSYKEPDKKEDHIDHLINEATIDLIKIYEIMRNSGLLQTNITTQASF